MQEALLHYIWKHSLFKKKTYISDTGERISILDPGTHNYDGGPDFTNARIRIENTIWAGNVEIHVHSSDWCRHNHQKNPAYNNVILHVTEKNDKPCTDFSDRRIPSIVLDFERNIEKKYNYLLQHDELVRCSEYLAKLDRSLLPFWLSALAIERIESKTQYVRDLIKATNNNWEEAFYIHIARSFGLKINAVPFELLAKTTPLKILAKHCDNLFQIEALLYGQAGFLEINLKDDYHSLLKKEYQHLKNKYQLKGIDMHLWKFLRLRPPNFPTLRLAEFASLIHHSKALFSKVLDCEGKEQVYDLFHTNASSYWKNHFTFGKESKHTQRSMGKSSVDNLIINTIVPFMFVYGSNKNIEILRERSIRLLDQVSPEKNTITRQWKAVGIAPENAAESQALIQLTTFYCKLGKCLDCQIGSLILNRYKE